MTITKGNEVRLDVTFKVRSTLTDPTTVTLKLLPPGGAITTPSPTKDSTGIYHYTFTPNVSGTWGVRWEGTGACVAAVESAFTVLHSSF